METNPTLRQIYNNLQDGRIYGYDFTKCKYPFFDPVLYLTKMDILAGTTMVQVQKKKKLKILIG